MYYILYVTNNVSQLNTHNVSCSESEGYLHDSMGGRGFLA